MYICESNKSVVLYVYNICLHSLVAGPNYFRINVTLTYDVCLGCPPNFSYCYALVNTNTEGMCIEQRLFKNWLFTTEF